MPRNLATDWVIIATSGNTIDGRFIEKKWLEDMAETYNPKVYSAKINLDHEFDFFGPQGSVQALKIEPATEPQLKGDIHLFAKLCPSDELIYANRRGRFTHSSIEVKENFRGTGKFYLGAMAVTDKPASVGTTELQFSEKDKNLFLSGPQLNFSEIDKGSERNGDSDSEIDGRIRSFFKNLFNTDKAESQDTPMDKEQFTQFSTTQNKTNQLLESLIEKFATLTPEKPDADDKDKGGDNKDFVTKKDYDDLSEKYTKLETKITELEKTPLRFTQSEEDLGALEAEI